VIGMRLSAHTIITGGAAVDQKLHDAVPVVFVAADPVACLSIKCGQ